MTVPTDMSIMDFLFQRNDSYKMDDKDFSIKNEIMDIDIPDLMHTTTNADDSFLTEEWPSTPDEFLDSILNEGGELGNVLEPPASSCSDSGLSSDLQDVDHTDQIILGDDEDILSSTLSSPGPSISEVGGLASPLHSDISTSPGYQSDVYHISEINNDHPVINIVQENGKNNMRQSKSLQAVTILNQKNLQQTKSANVKQIIRVQQMSGNPRSILLPVSVKDLRTIKIINTPGKKTPANIKLAAANLLQQTKKASLKNNIIISQHIADDVNDHVDVTTTSDDDICDESNSEASQSGYPRLQLTPEEQRLLAKEGISLPTSYPLTKHEERELKRIRRKIRNKISAQDSRKRKKEYVDGLEDRVKQCTEENQTLLKRIKVLQTQNQTLVSQLRRLQTLVSRKMCAASGGAGGAAIGKAQPATCLMVLLLSLALISVPSLKRGANTELSKTNEIDVENKVDEYVGKRALLFSKPTEDFGDEDLNMDDLLTFHGDNGYESPAKKSKLYPPRLDDDISLDGLDSSEYFSSKKYIEPPLDDVWPPPTSAQKQAVAPSNDPKHNASHPNIVVVRVDEDK